MLKKDVCKIGDCIKNIISRIIYMIIYIICAGFFVVYVKQILEMCNLKAYVFCVLISLSFLYCSIRFLYELLMIPIRAYGRKKNTSLLATTFTGISYEERIKLLIVENYCPVIENACLEGEGKMNLNGYYSKHTLFIKGDEIKLTSQKHDSKADIEANKIMRFIVTSMQ